MFRARVLYSLTSHALPPRIERCWQVGGCPPRQHSIYPGPSQNTKLQNFHEFKALMEWIKSRCNITGHTRKVQSQICLGSNEKSGRALAAVDAPESIGGLHFEILGSKCSSPTRQKVLEVGPYGQRTHERTRVMGQGMANTVDMEGPALQADGGLLGHWSSSLETWLTKSFQDQEKKASSVRHFRLQACHDMAHTRTQLQTGVPPSIIDHTISTNSTFAV
jgi:hypothetical protein